MPATTTTTTPPDHYTLLALPPPPHIPTRAQLRNHYHRALLAHHPDKSRPGSESATTIDHLAHAYHTLLSPTLRHAYNLTLSADDPSCGSDAVVQTVDLDELQQQQQHPKDEKRRWTRGCRCGEAEGYVITEVELEEAAADGDGVGVVLVGCVGCSLWLKVEFGVVDDEEEEGEGVNG